MNIDVIQNTNSETRMSRQELTLEQTEWVVAGAKRGSSRAIIDFVAWAACGFGHNYFDTGKTKIDMDGPIPTRFKEVQCIKCGHRTWKRVGAVSVK